MDNEKNVEVSTKTSIAVQLATGIAILALVTAGSGLIAYLATPRLSKDGPAIRTGGSPSAFNLLSPDNGVDEQSNEVLLTWQASVEQGYFDNITQSSPWSFIKSANASHMNMGYTVHIWETNDPSTEQVSSKMGSISYTATGLLPGREYTWKVVASSGHGSKSSNQTFTLNIAGADWLASQDYPLPGPGEGAACGGSKVCDDIGIDDADGLGGFLVDNLSCSEWNDVWLTCSGTTNKCPDNLEDKCLQMSICQCNGIPPGNQACADYVATFTDPCSI
ncbi:fibronectin type III domain-containing protein [Patescibacteria group bacterium]|nr:fibronectin type III domain-containing protein [Patescibacteria group bacterium]